MLLWITLTISPRLDSCSWFLPLSPGRSATSCSDRTTANVASRSARSRSDRTRSNRSRISSAGAWSWLGSSSSFFSFFSLAAQYRGFRNLDGRINKLSARAFRRLHQLNFCISCLHFPAFFAQCSPIPWSRETHHSRLRWSLVSGGGVGRLFAFAC